MLTITMSNNHFKHRYTGRSAAKFINQYFKEVAGHYTFVNLQFFRLTNKHLRLTSHDIAFY